MLREGQGEPVVLFHGVTCSERVWNPVIPLLSCHFEVFAPTSLGHRGGETAGPGIGIDDLVNDAEATLDRLQLDRPHLVGSSLGGWIAIELARRGRAGSVCALSPAGCWDISAKGQHHATKTLKGVARLTQATRWALPLASRLGIIRKFAMRENAVNGDRLTSEELVSMADDLLGCTAKYDLLNTNEAMEPLRPAPCPILLAWAEFDRIFPPGVNGPIARELMPEAQWRMLPSVGHLPMLDDPELVARTIRDWVGNHSQNSRPDITLSG